MNMKKQYWKICAADSEIGVHRYIGVSVGGVIAHLWNEHGCSIDDAAFDVKEIINTYKVRVNICNSISADEFIKDWVKQNEKIVIDVVKREETFETVVYLDVATTDEFELFNLLNSLNKVESLINYTVKIDGGELTFRKTNDKVKRNKIKADAVVSAELGY